MRKYGKEGWEEKRFLPPEKFHSSKNMFDWILGRSKAVKQSKSLRLILSSELPRLEESSNQITTTKYTFYNFIPKNLAFQFSNVANVYFLFLICLQVLPEFNIVPLGVIAMPLLIIIAITALKDALEDWKRLQSDNLVNTRDTYSCKRYLYPVLNS